MSGEAEGNIGKRGIGGKQKGRWGKGTRRSREAGGNRGKRENVRGRKKREITKRGERVFPGPGVAKATHPGNPRDFKAKWEQTGETKGGDR